MFSFEFEYKLFKQIIINQQIIVRYIQLLNNI